MNRDTSWKRRFFEIIDAQDDGGMPNHIFDYFIIILIILNLLAIFIETYRPVYLRYQGLFDSFELFTVLVFTVEYLLRVWTCTCYPEFSHPISGRIRYAFSFMMIIDILAIIPFYLTLLTPLNPGIVKLLRLLRLFRIFKLLRYYRASEVIYEVFRKNRDYLISVMVIQAIFLILVSYTIFLVESDAQPDAFQDVDNAIWWAVVTMTTVGYGDMYPVTDLGKALTTIVLLIGVGLIALPTGIIASGFLEAMRFHRGGAVYPLNISMADEIFRLRDLRDDGEITDEEYHMLKKRLIDPGKKPR